jgi:hypothetical protein
MAMMLVRCSAGAPARRADEGVRYTGSISLVEQAGNSNKECVMLRSGQFNYPPTPKGCKNRLTTSKP